MDGDWYPVIYSLHTWSHWQHPQPHHPLQKVHLLNLFLQARLFLIFRSKSSIFHHLLSCLCAADILFLISNLLALPFHSGFRNTIINFFFPFFESCCHFAYSASIFFIVAVTIDRWQAVCFPYWYQVGITQIKLTFI